MTMFRLVILFVSVCGDKLIMIFWSFQSALRLWYHCNKRD